MKKIIFVLLAAASLLASCGQSEEEKDITEAVYSEYKESLMKTDTEVPFNILNLEVKDKREDGARTVYDVSFTIQEMYPERRHYYDGTASVEYGGALYKVLSMDYKENEKLNR